MSAPLRLVAACALLVALPTARASGAVELVTGDFQGNAPLTHWIAARGNDSVTDLWLDWNNDAAWDYHAAGRSLAVQATWEAPGAYQYVVNATMCREEAPSVVACLNETAVGTVTVWNHVFSLGESDTSAADSGAAGFPAPELTPARVWSIIVALALLGLLGVAAWFRLVAGQR